MDASTITRTKALEDESWWLKKMFAELSVQNDLLKEASEKMTRPSQRREMAAMARREVSIAVACRTFGVSENCCRNGPLLSGDNEQIANLLVGLTDARKTWGSGCAFCICAT